MTRVSCPFCNAEVPVGDPAPPRVSCPRCGEGFRPPASEASGGRQPPEPAIPGDPADGMERHPGRQDQGADAPRSPRLALLVGVLLSVLIVVGWLYGPWQTPAPPPPETRPPATVPPTTLSGLTFLPPSTNVVLAVQPAALVAHAERTGTDPNAVLAGLGLPATFTNSLDQFGLPLASIDQLVVGAAVTDELLPGLVGVLRLRTPPADEDAFLKRLKAEKRPLAGRPTYSVVVGVPMLLTKPDPVTYLFVLKDADLAAADRPAPPGAAHLPKALQESLAARLDPASFVWLATDADRWHEKAAVKLFLKPDRLDVLAKGRAVAAGLAFAPNPTLRLSVRTADPATAGAVRAAFRQRLGEPATVGGDGEWATAETPFDPKAEGLKQLLADATGK